MALNAVSSSSISAYCAENKKNVSYSQLGNSDVVSCRPTFINLRIRSKRECVLEDENPSCTDVVEEAAQMAMAGQFHKSFSTLPKPLSATDVSSLIGDGLKIRVAYQGVPGAYSEAAALQVHPNCETVPCDQFEATFKAVELCLADKAVLPIENSIEGSFHCNYALLLRHRLHIVGEVQFIVNHCLLGLPGVRKEDLKRVLSQLQALNQCEITLKKLGVSRVGVDDTAQAAQIVACERVRDMGAVASARAANIYGLDVLAENIQLSFYVLRACSTLGKEKRRNVMCMSVAFRLRRWGECRLYTTFLQKGVVSKTQSCDDKSRRSNISTCFKARPSTDHPDNITRFLILAREPIIPGTNWHYMTSIVFSLREGTGILFRALAVFALRDIVLTKIESCPQRLQPLRVVDDSNRGSAIYFDYLFYIDFAASTMEPRAQQALGSLQEFSKFIRVLGCYPIIQSDEGIS